MRYISISTGNQILLVIDILEKYVSAFIYPLLLKYNFFSRGTHKVEDTQSLGQPRAVVEPWTSFTMLCDVNGKMWKKIEELPESKMKERSSEISRKYQKQS